MLMRHQFGARSYVDSGHIRSRFGGIADQNRQARAGRESGKGLPLDILRADCAKWAFIGLVLA
jgi:hypothetical protein